MNLPCKCFCGAVQRGLSWAVFLLMLLLPTADSVPAAAQPFPFGSYGDLSERLQSERWHRDRQVFALGGLSLIGAQWRVATEARLELITRPLSARFAGTFRAGPLGYYAPDIDEPYDVLRLVEFVRYNAPVDGPLHLRAGFLDGIRLGIGHIVNFYSSAVAWDERTVGAEFSYGGRWFTVEGFTADVLLGGVTGGRVAVHPDFLAKGLSARRTRLGFSAVSDRARPRRIDAYSADAQIELFATGDVHFVPYVSYAWYPRFGDGLAFGADVESYDFLNLLSFRLRIGAFYNSRQFIPGYVGALYSVHNRYARIVRASGEGVAGVSLGESRGASDLVTEFRLEVPPGFSMWYYFRRHFGGQRLSEFHFRLFVLSARRLRFGVGIDKLGAAGFLGIFDDFGDLSALEFQTDYRIVRALYVSLSARYSFERVGSVTDEAPRFLVQRRFEPLAGFRLGFD